uniref:Uncharacterized protein n=1 Tax=Anguilla anguilla TaxID=7936 RepID=A0A0E9Q182_ANGAN
MFNVINDNGRAILLLVLYALCLNRKDSTVEKVKIVQHLHLTIMSVLVS